MAGSERSAVLGRLGGWDTVRGVLAVAACVALPLGPPLAAVVGRWLPAGYGPLVGVAVTGLVWLLLVGWLLDGVRSHVGSLLRACPPGERPMLAARTGPAAARAAGLGRAYPVRAEPAAVGAPLA